MKFLILNLLLVVIGAKGIQPRSPAGPSAGGSASGSANAQVGGCSLGVGAEGSADGGVSDTRSASGSGSGSAKVSADGCGDTSKNYTYTIKAKRTEQITPSSMPVLYLYYKISDPQNMTVFKDVDDDHPFMLEIYVTNDDANYDYSADGINACNDPDDGTWDYVAVKLIQGGLMPDGKCPVKKGNYDINQAVDPITVTFPKKIDCGDYVLYSNLDQDDVWALQVAYSFTIDKDDNCTS